MPAFGSPTSAASATSFRRRSSCASSPGSPVSAKRGVWRVGVAKWRLPRPPAAAARDDDPRAGSGQVGDDLSVGVEHLRPHRHAQLDVGTVGAVLAAPAARLPARGLEDPLRAEGREIAEVGIGDQDHVAAAAAVAAVGTTLRHVLLAAKAEAAVPAAARNHLDLRPIVKHPPSLPPGRTNQAPSSIRSRPPLFA